MTSYNRVILTGRVAIPPRLHYRPDGSPVIQFPLELDETEDLTGQPLIRHGKGQAVHDGSIKKNSGCFINIVAIGKLAELKPDLQNGQHILVVGKLNPRSWKTSEGKNRFRMEVIATDLQTIDETKHLFIQERRRT